MTHELNDSQRAAVEYCDGPSLVIAGAGSGKTRVLTYKVAYLLEKGIMPWNILALTFTNKAANEMRQRINAIAGDNRAQYIRMGTFHSVFSRILRVEAERIGYSQNFTIYDDADQKSLIKAIIKELGLNDKVYKPSTVASRINMAKNNIITPDDYANDRAIMTRDFETHMPDVAKVYKAYSERCRMANAMDFDDLLTNTYLLLQENPDVLEKYATAFEYILVDEYQDTNVAQHSIVLQLAKNHQHVCVVGDDAQSIYSFRGADIDNILYFTKTYPGTRVFKLEQNYRSTQTIVSAANSLISKNQRQIHKDVFSEKDLGEPIGVLQAYSDVEEGEMVVNKIAALRRQSGYGYADFAVLYRTNAQSRIFEEALRKRNMPYRIYGGLSFYQRKEIKDVIAYFRLVANPNDEEAFKRVINYPARGIGDTTVGKIVAAATVNNVSLWTVLCEPLTYGLNFNKGTAGKLQGFRDLIASFMEDLGRKNASELGEDIVRQAGIINDVCQDNSPENLSRKENIEELMNGMKDFCAERLEEGNERIALGDFLSEVSLLTDQDSDKDDDGEKITLMTVHSAKGLEFRNVFVVGLEENLFPSSMAGDSPRALEEERRLFYVAITRAEEHCFLSYAKTRMRYGKTEFGSPSRFLHDIDARYLSLPQNSLLGRRVDEGAERFRRSSDDLFHSATRSQYGISASSPAGERKFSRESLIAPTVPRKLKRVEAVMGAAPAPSGGKGLQAGQLIEHERFGRGEVLRVEGAGDNAKATIRFEHAGEKQLLLRFARFKVIG